MWVGRWGPAVNGLNGMEGLLLHLQALCRKRWQLDRMHGLRIHAELSRLDLHPLHHRHWLRRSEGRVLDERRQILDHELRREVSKFGDLEILRPGALNEGHQYHDDDDESYKDQGQDNRHEEDEQHLATILVSLATAVAGVASFASAGLAAAALGTEIAAPFAASCITPMTDTAKLRTIPGASAARIADQVVHERVVAEGHGLHHTAVAGTATAADTHAADAEDRGPQAHQEKGQNQRRQIIRELMVLDGIQVGACSSRWCFF
mmetsp:Transcript_25193/g.54810  ORF Transcript_25193/g.54810 Transcript_25193/m.54810 type:complete len:263 (+) Transcript_25193:325-1113(+)